MLTALHKIAEQKIEQAIAEGRISAIGRISLCRKTI